MRFFYNFVRFFYNTSSIQKYYGQHPKALFPGKNRRKMV